MIEGDRLVVLARKDFNKIMSNLAHVRLGGR